MNFLFVIALTFLTAGAHAKSINCVSSGAPHGNYHVQLHLEEKINDGIFDEVWAGRIEISADHLKAYHNFDVEVEVSPIKTRVEVGTSYTIHIGQSDLLLALQDVPWNGNDGEPYFKGVVDFYGTGHLKCGHMEGAQ